MGRVPASIWHHVSLQKWFSPFLSLQPCNTVPQPENYFYLLLHNCNFTTIMNQNVKIFGDRSLPKGLRPTHWLKTARLFWDKFLTYIGEGGVLVGRRALMTQSLLSVLPDDKVRTHPLPAAAAGWPGAHTKSSAALSPGMAEAPAAESSADGPCSSCQESPLSCLPPLAVGKV